MIPKFKSEKEEADFWQIHSSLDYPEDFTDAEEPLEIIRLRKGRIKMNKDLKRLKERLYIILYTEDAFEGVSVPLKWKPFVDEWEKKSIDVDEPISVFTDYDEYRDFEVESAHQAKDGSYGTIYYESTKDDINEFKDWFSDWYDNDLDKILESLPNE